jgi:ATP-binding cassette subfamily B protein
VLSIPGREPDRILVIQDGTLIESGTHDELYQQENGLYRHLAELQFNLKH